MSAGWVRPCSCRLWGGDALLLSTGAAGNRNPTSSPALSLTPPITHLQGYLAVHWRRGDFVSLSNDPRGRTPPSDMWQTPEDLIEAVKGLLERHNLDRVFLLTNEV